MCCGSASSVIDLQHRPRNHQLFRSRRVRSEKQPPKWRDSSSGIDFCHRGSGSFRWWDFPAVVYANMLIYAACVDRRTSNHS